MIVSRFSSPLAIYRYVGEQALGSMARSRSRNHAAGHSTRIAARRSGTSEGTAWLSRQWRRGRRRWRGDGERAGERNEREGESASRVSGSVGRVTERRRVPLAPALTRLAGTVISPMRGVAPTCRLFVILVAHAGALLEKERARVRGEGHGRGRKIRRRLMREGTDAETQPHVSLLWLCYGIYLHTLTRETRYGGLGGWGGER